MLGHWSSLQRTPSHDNASTYIRQSADRYNRLRIMYSPLVIVGWITSSIPKRLRDKAARGRSSAIITNHTDHISEKLIKIHVYPTAIANYSYQCCVRCAHIILSCMCRADGNMLNRHHSRVTLHGVHRALNTRLYRIFSHPRCCL